MIIADVYSELERKQAVHLERLCAYLRMPSISAEGNGIAENAAFLVDLLGGMGFAARSIETAGWPMLWGHRAGPASAPHVLLYGHYDVQPADPVDLWHTPPFEPTIRDGRIYARGAGDNKGQHFANLLALETTLSVTGNLPCSVTVLLEGEEEIGSPHIADFVRAHKEMLDVDLVITSDGPVHDSGQWTVEFGVRGVVSFELRAKGANRDLHSGNFGGIAPNPVWTLVHALATMKNPEGQITISGLMGVVVPPTMLEQEAIAELPDGTLEIMQDLELSRFDHPLGRGLYERLMAWPTLTINGLHGGYGGPGSKTVLPCVAMAKCDIRLVPNMTVAGTLEAVQEHLARVAPEVEFIPGGGMEPSKTPLDSPFAAPIAQAIEHATGQRPLRVPAMGGSLPEYVWTQTFPTLHAA